MEFIERLFLGRSARAAPVVHDPVRLLAAVTELRTRLVDKQAKADHYRGEAAAERERRVAMWRAMGTPADARKLSRDDMIVRFLAHAKALDADAAALQQHLLTLDQQYETLNQQEATALAVDALRHGNAALRQALAALDPALVDRTQAEMERLVDAAHEVSQEAAQPVAAGALSAVTLTPDEVAAFLDHTDGGGDWSSTEETTAVPVTLPRRPAVAAVATEADEDVNDFALVALV